MGVRAVTGISGPERLEQGFIGRPIGARRVVGLLLTFSGG